MASVIINPVITRSCSVESTAAAVTLFVTLFLGSLSWRFRVRTLAFFELVLILTLHPNSRLCLTCDCPLTTRDSCRRFYFSLAHAQHRVVQRSLLRKRHRCSRGAAPSSRPPAHVDTGHIINVL